MIYLDNAATTKVLPEVLDAMLPYLTDNYGNAGSLHRLGRDASKAIETARQQVADFLNCQPESIIFTSGGSEANNLAIKGLAPYLLEKRKTGILTSAVEHDSVFSALRDMKRDYYSGTIPVNRGCICDAVALEDLLRCTDFRDFHKASFWLNELFCSLGIVLGESSLNELAKTLFAAATSDTSTRFFVFDECCVTIERGQLRIYDRSLWNLSNIPQIKIKGSGEYDFGPMKIKVEAVDVSPASGLDAQSLIRGGGSAVDADKIGFPLICRTMQEGDRFSPYGLKGSKSVADFLNSRKVDLLFKNIVPVLTKKDGSIVCLPSLEIDDRFKVTSQSKKVLVISASVC